MDDLLGRSLAGKAVARRQGVPAGDDAIELVFDFDGAGRAVLGGLLHAFLSPVRDYVHFGLCRVTVHLEDVRATADTQLAAGAEFFIDG